MLTLLATLALGGSLSDVEAAIRDAEQTPSAQSTRHAFEVANTLRQELDSPQTVVAETYAVVLGYPYDTRQFSRALYVGRFPSVAKKARRYPLTGKAVCALRDVLFTEGYERTQTEMQDLARKLKVDCGPPQRVDKAPAPGEPLAGKALEQALVDALSAKAEAAALPSTPETRALEAELEANTREAEAKALDSARAVADAQADAEAAQKKMAEALRHASSRAGCEDEGADVAERIAACDYWLAVHANDVEGLLMVAKLHTAQVSAGVEVRHNAVRAITRFQELKGYLPASAHADVDTAIEGLRPALSAE